MATLFDIQKEIQKLEQILVENDGVLTEEMEDKFDLFHGQLEEKVDKYAFALDYLKSREQYFKQMSSQFADASKVLANSQKALKERIDFIMGEDRKKLEGKDFYFNRQNTAGKLVIDGEVPKEYMKQIVYEEMDKDKLKEDLKQGKKINGARIEQGTTIRKYIKK